MTGAGLAFVLAPITVTVIGHRFGQHAPHCHSVQLTHANTMQLDTSAVEFRRDDLPVARPPEPIRLICAYDRWVTSRIEAWAGLAEDIGAALQTFGSRLRESSAAGVRPELPGEDVEEGLGSSQLRVLAAVRATGDVGVTSHAVAKSTGIANSNTPRILKALAEHGLVQASDTKPAIWTATR
jgi:hypothetical protein